MKLIRSRNGFTLVELLIVIAVIGVLAALFVPVFLRGRKGAHVVTCLSNLRQLGAAVQMYQSDFDGHLPSENPRSIVTYNSNGPSVADPLAGYGMTQKLFHCPETPSSGRSFQGSSDYVVRFVLEPRRTGAQQTEAWRVEPQPSSVIAFCKWHLDKPEAWVVQANGFYAPNGTFQVLRADGSVAKIQSSQVRSKTFSNSYDANLNPYVLFPNEVWPPTLTRVE